MSLIDNPKFWFGFLALEIGLPLLIPNKKWAGALMVFVGLLFIGSALGIGDSIGASSAYIASHASVIALLGGGVLIVGAVTIIVRLCMDKKWRYSKTPEVLSLPRVEGFEMLVTRAPENTKDLPLVHFITQNRASAEIVTNGKPRALRFIIPVEQVLRESDLPIEVPVGRGKVIVKRFTEKGFAFEERDTVGDQVRAEIYFKDTLESATSTVRRVTPEQRVRFIDAVGRLTLKEKTVLIKSAIPDSETADYWHSLVELFKSSEMRPDPYTEQFAKYDPSGLVLVVEDPDPNRLSGHAQIIFNLLTEAKIDFVLGSDGVSMQQKGWCYLHVGRKLDSGRVS
jgi:hypothetical protein